MIQDWSGSLCSIRVENGDADPEDWFPVDNDAMSRATTVCSRCPIIEKCFDYGVAEDMIGVWGGVPLNWLQRMRSDSHPYLKPSPCGCFDAESCTHRSFCRRGHVYDKIGKDGYGVCNACHYLLATGLPPEARTYKQPGRKASRYHEIEPLLYEGKTNKEIAEIVGCTADAVRQHRRNWRKNLENS